LYRLPRRADVQHCDFYWAAEAVEWAYESCVDDIERTRPRDDDAEDDTEDRRERQPSGGAEGANGDGWGGGLESGRDAREKPRVGLGTE
jgi:hypothetical protein